MLKLLVIIHHHLNRGGVSRVIENHLQAIATWPATHWPERVLVMYGGRANGWNHEVAEQLDFPVDYATLPLLDYDSFRESDTTRAIEQEQLVESIKREIAGVGGDVASTVIHTHNHSLGKSASLPLVLESLAEAGFRLLLQIHDFAEDLRPTNYRHLLDCANDEQRDLRLYPQAGHIHYATLNRRDFEVLSMAGIAAERLHRLPNPVDAPELKVDDASLRQQARTKLEETYGVSSDRPFVLYPVRGIQRKNLGELLLWATLFPNASFAITLPPMNPVELTSYEMWQAYAQSWSLPVLFGVGSKLSLDESYAAADAVITTSVAEGFGLVFLEASTRNRLLLGRNLPGITADFVDSGVQFPHLDNQLRIPTALIDGATLEESFDGDLDQLRRDYRLSEWSQSEVRQAKMKFLEGETLDFGWLDSSFQVKILERLNEDEESRHQVQCLNPKISILDEANSADAFESHEIAHNQAMIREHYSLSVIGRRLEDIYSRLLRTTVGVVEQSTSLERNVLQEFVKPSRVHPLRLES